METAEANRCSGDAGMIDPQKVPEKWIEVKLRACDPVLLESLTGSAIAHRYLRHRDRSFFIRRVAMFMAAQPKRKWSPQAPKKRPISLSSAHRLMRDA